MPGITEIAIAIVESQNRFLAGVRPLDKPLGGMWEFPGGKVEAGESPPQAAIRECQEETGLQVIAGQVLMVHEQTYDHGTVRLHFISCTVRDNDTCEEPFQWIPRSDLATLEFPEGNRGVLKLLLTGG